MFTGIIRSLGKVTQVAQEDGAVVLTVGGEVAPPLAEGDSVAVNGACLTALSVTQDSFVLRLMQETLDKTNLGDLQVGSVVNLERPLTGGQTLDGHFVLGHVDGVSEVVAITAVGEDRIFTFKPPQDLMKYLIPKGSVALDGVSLTVVDVHDDTFTVSIMPYTLQHTTFGQAAVGYQVNMEADMIAKQVVSVLEKHQEATTKYQTSVQSQA